MSMTYLTLPVPGKAMISKPNLALNRNVSFFIVVFEIAEL